MHILGEASSRNYLKTASVALCSLLVLILPTLVAAQAGTDRFGLEYGTGAGLGTRDVRATVAALINIALGILGLIMLIIILVAGAKWMMAAGSEDQVAEAKNSISQAVVGLLVVFVAFAITKFVFSILERST